MNNKKWEMKTWNQVLVERAIEKLKNENNLFVNARYSARKKKMDEEGCIGFYEGVAVAPEDLIGKSVNDLADELCCIILSHAYECIADDEKFYGIYLRDEVLENPVYKHIIVSFILFKTKEDEEASHEQEQ